MIDVKVIDMKKNYYAECSYYGSYLLNLSKFPYDEALEGECQDIIALMRMDFFTGSCLKYLWRLNKKGGIFSGLFYRSDLKKALYYANEAVKNHIQWGVESPEWLKNLAVILAAEISDSYRN